MSEYLLKANDGDYLILASDGFASALHPAGYECSPIEGWGDYRMRCGSTEVAFSFEDPGIQMIVGDDLPAVEADQLADAVSEQLHRATGRAINLIPL